MIISGGFAGTGVAGQRLQDEITAICHQYGLRLLGPNTSGFVNPALSLAAPFPPTIWQKRWVLAERLFPRPRSDLKMKGLLK